MSESDASAGVGGQYLSFTLGGEDYGVDILRVQEIKGWETVRPLPDTPDYVKGVLDLRGKIVPIIDLRTRLKLDHAEYTPTTVTIVLTVESESGPNFVGIVVDGVSDVLDVPGDDVRAAPDLGAHINTKYITGMVIQGERMVVLLDVDRLFNPDELGLPVNVG
ncbi:MAG: chemotaxis protein CheW [Gammaproteobacteria bacterium]|nr:chemotaxis protein CheW [Gammaproteobacteria bacterium]